MPNTLDSPAVQTVLRRLLADARADDERRPAIDPGWMATASAHERSDLLQELYLPISEQGGRLLYSLVRAVRPATVVEFGLSFGISTIFLAAGIADLGTGRVVTTELSTAKITRAKANLAEAGLDRYVSVLDGDALETLADLSGPVDLVLLDGWKDLCLPVLRVLEPRLRTGALVVADDIDLPGMADYLAWVRDPDHGYVSVSFPVEDGMELSCWTGADASPPEGATEP